MHCISSPWCINGYRGHTTRGNPAIISIQTMGGGGGGTVPSSYRNRGLLLLPRISSYSGQSYGWYLLIQGYFCAVLNYAEKAELSKCFWYSKRKLGVTMHFFFYRKQSFNLKEASYIALRFTVFTNCCLIVSKKMPRYPQFYFWIPVAHTKICFSRIVNCAKTLLY